MSPKGRALLKGSMLMAAEGFAAMAAACADGFFGSVIFGAGLAAALMPAFLLAAGIFGAAVIGESFRQEALSLAREAPLGAPLWLWMLSLMAIDMAAGLARGFKAGRRGRGLMDQASGIAFWRDQNVRYDCIRAGSLIPAGLSRQERARRQAKEALISIGALARMIWMSPAIFAGLSFGMIAMVFREIAALSIPMTGSIGKGLIAAASKWEEKALELGGKELAKAEAEALGQAAEQAKKRSPKGSKAL